MLPFVLINRLNENLTLTFQLCFVTVFRLCEIKLDLLFEGWVNWFCYLKRKYVTSNFNIQGNPHLTHNLRRQRYDVTQKFNG